MKNKIGIYYAFWEQEWSADYLKYVKKVAGLGFDILELAAGALMDMSQSQRKILAQAAKDEGVELTYCIGLPKNYDLASDETTIRKRGIDYVKSLLSTIGEMEGNILGGILYGSWPSMPEFPINDKTPWWDRSVESVKQIAKTAQDQGITYCLEVVNRFEQFLINTVDEGKKFVADVGSPNIKLLLDSFHMNIEEDFLGEALRSAGNDIGHFHIGETNRRVPGRGHMPWDEIFDGLKDSHYTGYVVMEPFLKMGGGVGQDIKVWRNLLENDSPSFLDNEAKFALSFVRQKLAERNK